MPGAFGNDSLAIPILTHSELPEITLDTLQLLEESTSCHQSTSSSPLSDINIPEPTSIDELSYPNRDRIPLKRYRFPYGSAHHVYEPNSYQEAMNSLDVDKWIAAMQIEH
jgi:hypothetical protein